MKRHVPNALSVIRALLGIPILVLAIIHYWQTAFWLFALACMTDFLDGLAAKMLGVESKFGKEVLDPTCDGIMSWAAIGGLIVQGDSKTIIFNLCWVGPLLAAGLWLDRLKKHSHNTGVRRTADIILFTSYCTSLYVAGFVYFHRAFNGDMDVVWWRISIVAVPLIVYSKKHRIMAVFSGDNL